MELPNKKIWAIYYKTISRPMSFEKIYVHLFLFYYRWASIKLPSLQKHLKRKEYSHAAQFAQDVELVFSNAMQFNEDNTPLWEAARQLKVHISTSPVRRQRLMRSTGVLRKTDGRPS